MQWEGVGWGGEKMRFRRLIRRIRLPTCWVTRSHHRLSRHFVETFGVSRWCDSIKFHSSLNNTHSELGTNSAALSCLPDVDAKFCRNTKDIFGGMREKWKQRKRKNDEMENCHLHYAFLLTWFSLYNFITSNEPEILKQRGIVLILSFLSSFH